MMATLFLQVQNTLFSSADSESWELVEPIAVLTATALVILITFYMSNLKHDLLDGWLVDRHHRIRRKTPYAKLMKFFFNRQIFTVHL
jgi:hypothetical protein